MSRGALARRRRCSRTEPSHCLFVSSLSVYADASRPEQDERAPVARLGDPATEDVMANYGALKAACEDEVRAAFGARATVVRPDLIVGPHGPTDRFSYWIARFVHPELLGDRPAGAVVPAPPSRPVQFIDARDLAEWMVDLVARRAAGTYNACSPPGSCTMGVLVDALAVLGRARGAAVAPSWTDERALLDHGVAPWTGLPLWIPDSDLAMAGFMLFACVHGPARGLRFRPLERTLADTSDWLAVRDNASAWGSTLAAATERAILSTGRE